uniref:Titin n=1 Tax=Drosophila pseudoobscura pseudoobscura TaxID=46245 RepID=B5DUB7_DROPS
MNLIRLFAGFFLVTIFVIGKAVCSSSNTMNKSKQPNIKTLGYSEFKETIIRPAVKKTEQFELTHHNVAADPTMALKRVIQKYDKPFDNRTTDHHYRSINARKKKKSPAFDNSNSNNFHTFEEIHEHIDETYDSGSQYQASEPLGSETLPNKNLENIKNKKNRNRIKTKIKHHHHHHHHNHIKELIKTVPQPYSVEKVVHVPIEKVVEKVVHVPKIINVTIEKIVHVPIEKIVEKVIHIPKPYVVEKIVEKIVHVPKPYPVLRTVPYPIEIKVPMTVEKKVPFPIKVEVERKIPIYIHTKEPYKFEKSNIEHYNQVDQSKFTFEGDHLGIKEHEQSTLPTNIHQHRIYKLKDINLPNKVDDPPYTFQPEHNKHLKESPSQQYTSASVNIPRKFLRSNLMDKNIDGQDDQSKFNLESDNLRTKEHDRSALHANHPDNKIFKLKEFNFPNKIDFQNNFQPQYTNFDLTKSANQQYTSASDNIPIKFLSDNFQPDTTKSELNPNGIGLPFINSTLLFFNPQESTYPLHGIPFSLPVNYVHLQPTTQQNQLGLDSTIPETSAESSRT